MRSLIGGLRAQAPISYAPTRASTFQSATAGGTGSSAPSQQHLAAMAQVGTLSAIVGRTSEATSQVNWRLWRKARPGQPADARIEVVRHAALDLWNKPNPFFTRQEFVETVQQHYELCGEQWWMVSKAGTLPLELWPVRPDRMRPVPHAQKYLAGAVYRSPDGEEVPLANDEVVFVRRPNPLDTYRGLGVVQSILVDLDSARYSAEWNRNFFINSAEPGGIIQVDKRLSDDEFNEMVSRWREQHQGVAQAHRVAVLEQGQWVDRKFSMRDMQFPELRELSSEMIREAFGFPKPLLGTVTDVNRSNAEAAEVVFARWLITPRLERIKGALNNDLLPMFGATARDLEFDYDSPVPEDAALDLEALTARTVAYTLLTTQARVTPESAAEVCGLPKLEHSEVPPLPAASGPLVPEPTPDDVVDDTGGADDAPTAVLRRASGTSPTAATAHAHVADRLDPPPLPTPPGDTPATIPDGAGPDMGPVQEQWEIALAIAVAAWLTASEEQKTALIQQIRDAVYARDLMALARLTVDTQAAGDDLGGRLVDVAEVAARHVVTEAALQHVSIGSGAVDQTALKLVGALAAATLGDGLRMSAAREAARVWGPGITADTIAGQVADHLESLTTAQPEYVIGGALTGAQAAGREATMLAGPSAALYADERLDGNTCQPCLSVDGKWVGNSDDPLMPWRALYPVRGYVSCLGRDRCRGGLAAVWRGGSDWKKWVDTRGTANA